MEGLGWAKSEQGRAPWEIGRRERRESSTAGAKLRETKVTRPGEAGGATAMERPRLGLAGGDRPHLGTTEELVPELQIDGVRAEQGMAMDGQRELGCGGHGVEQAEDGARVWELKGRESRLIKIRESGARVGR